MTLQQVDGITYVNGIRIETETIPVADIDEALLIMQEDIEHHKAQIEKEIRWLIYLSRQKN